MAENESQTHFYKTEGQMDHEKSIYYRRRVIGATVCTAVAALVITGSVLIYNATHSDPEIQFSSNTHPVYLEQKDPHDNDEEIDTLIGAARTVDNPEDVPFEEIIKQIQNNPENDSAFRGDPKRTRVQEHSTLEVPDSVEFVDQTDTTESN